MVRPPGRKGGEDVVHIGMAAPNPGSAPTAGWIPLDFTFDPPEAPEKVRETDPQPERVRPEACFNPPETLDHPENVVIGLILCLNI